LLLRSALLIVTLLSVLVRLLLLLLLLPLLLPALLALLARLLLLSALLIVTLLPFLVWLLPFLLALVALLLVFLATLFAAATSPLSIGETTRANYGRGHCHRHRRSFPIFSVHRSFLSVSRGESHDSGFRKLHSTQKWATCDAISHVSGTI
jgi:hypothetical protein